MLLKSWEKLPINMQNEYVKFYYDILLKKKYNLILKRLFDVVMSLILILFLSPVLIILGILIKFDSKGSILFKQERITQYGRTFSIYKFRTMVNNADKTGPLVTMHEDKRITRIGKKIRNTRLDELPQVFNVLKGEMSFVGARPEVKKYSDNYTPKMLATLLLPSGVTSETSLFFKNEAELIEKECGNDYTRINEFYVSNILPKKMELNLNYLKNFNICNDIKICFKTLFGKGG